MNQLEKLLCNDMSKLPDDKSKLKFLQDEVHFANPESCWGRFVINICNGLAVELMLRRKK